MGVCSPGPHPRPQAEPGPCVCGLWLSPPRAPTRPVSSLPPTPAVSLVPRSQARQYGCGPRTWSGTPETPGAPGLEAGAPGGAPRPVSQGHPRTGAPRRYPAADDPPRDPPAGSRPARKNRSGQRRAGAFRRRGRADFGLKGAAAPVASARTQRGAMRGRGWKGRAAGLGASPGPGGRRAAGWAGSGVWAPSARAGASGPEGGCAAGGERNAGRAPGAPALLPQRGGPRTRALGRVVLNSSTVL